MLAAEPGLGVYDDRTVRALLVAVVAAATLLLSAAALGQTVAIVPAGERDRPVVEHLSTQITGEVRWRTSDNARDANALLREAQGNWPEELIVTIDTENRVVRVLRVSDGTILSRVLEVLIAEQSPYAVSVAAVELLELAGHAPTEPEPEPRPEPEPAPPPAPPPQKPPPDVEPRKKRSEPFGRVLPGVGVVAGAFLTASADGDVSLLQPTVGADFRLTWVGSPWIGAAGLRASGLGGRERDVPFNQGEIQGIDLFEANVRYTRTEFSLRLAGGRREGPAEALGYVEAGLGFASATGTGELFRGGPAPDELFGEVNRTVFLAGAGIDLRYEIAYGLGLGLGVGAAFQPASARYTVLGRPAFDEGNAHIRGALLAVWQSP